MFSLKPRKEPPRWMLSATKKKKKSRLESQWDNAGAISFPQTEYLISLLYALQHAHSELAWVSACFAGALCFSLTQACFTTFFLSLQGGSPQFSLPLSWFSSWDLRVWWRAPVGAQLRAWQRPLGSSSQLPRDLVLQGGWTLHPAPLEMGAKQHCICM